MKHDSNRARQAHKPGHLLIGLLMGVSPWALSAQASAQTQAIAENGQVRIAYDIPAQDLADALTQYARQSDLRVLYPADRLAGRSAPQVRGSYTRAEALQLLMSRSGLSATIAGETIQIQEQRLPQQGRASAEPERVRANNNSPTEETDQASGEEEIVVTGTRIRGAPPAGSNVIRLDAEEIQQTGRSTVQEVLQTLPQNFSGSQNEFTQEGLLNARRNFSFASTVDLRGLGADATLTLVDGHRLAPAGLGGYVDISTIPLSAIDRIEVLADGASAAYGADAVAGVVNLILVDDFEGAESRIRFGATSEGGASERGFSQLFGTTWGTGQLMGAYEYRARDELNVADRDFLASANFTDRGGADFRRTLSNPGNIIRIGATNVSLSIPEGQDGTALSQSDLIAGLNRTELNEGAFLLPRQESQSFFVRFRQDITPTLEFYAHALGSERDAEADKEQLFANIVVPETNAYRQLNNLFPGQGNLTIAYYFGDDLGQVRNSANVRAWSGVVGARQVFPDSDWTIDVSAAYAHSEEFIANENLYNSLAIGPALASSNLATAFNPFADGSNTPAAVLAGLTFDIYTNSDAETAVFQAQADGPLWRIWGGDIRTAFGIERREEEFAATRIESYPTGPVAQFLQDPGERSVDAVFAEVFVPLVSAENDIPLVESLSISASLRHEDASDYGDETTPRVGVRWALSPDFALRGSWGRSFKGPLFEQMLGDTGLTYVTATAAQDPLADNGSTGILVAAGSNGNLRPETSTAWTAGFDFTPRWADGFSFRATYFDIDFEDRIASAGTTVAILANPAGLESIMFRDPSAALIAEYLALGPAPTGSLPADGVELIIDRRLVNLASQRIRGVDLSLNYSVESSLGDIGVFASASGLLQFEQTLTPSATPVVLVDTVNNPIDWRVRAGLSWRLDGWNAAVTGNYVDGYTDTVTIPRREIDAFTTWDLRFGYDWRRPDDERGTQLSLNILNVLNEDPPFVNSPTGYAFDAANASPLGRVVSLELRQRW